jgi:hypothetical protein
MFRMRKRKALGIGALGVVPLAAAAVAFVAMSAGAALVPPYQAVSDGTAGYYTQTGLTVHDVGAVISTNPAALNIGGVGTGGIGTQICDPNNGFGLQLGLVSNGKTFTVEYATGTLKGANADNCVGNGVLVSPHVLNANLTGLPVGDAVTVYTSYSVYKKTNGTKKQGRGQHFGAATFQATDANGFETYSATVWKLPVDNSLDMAGAGVQQDTTGMSACTPLYAFDGNLTPHNDHNTGPVLLSGTTVDYTGGSGACNDVADFSSVFINGHFGIFGFGPGLATFGQTHQVVTTGGGLKANAAVVAPNDTLTPGSGSGESVFSVYAGQVIG